MSSASSMNWSLIASSDMLEWAEHNRLVSWAEKKRHSTTKTKKMEAVVGFACDRDFLAYCRGQEAASLRILRVPPIPSNYESLEREISRLCDVHRDGRLVLENLELLSGDETRDLIHRLQGLLPAVEPTPKSSKSEKSEPKDQTVSEYRSLCRIILQLCQPVPAPIMKLWRSSWWINEWREFPRPEYTQRLELLGGDTRLAALTAGLTTSQLQRFLANEPNLADSQSCSKLAASAEFILKYASRTVVGDEEKTAGPGTSAAPFFKVLVDASRELEPQDDKATVDSYCEGLDDTSDLAALEAVDRWLEFSVRPASRERVRRMLGEDASSRGILLHGPNGAGKSHLLSPIARHCHIPVIKVYWYALYEAWKLKDTHKILVRGSLRMAWVIVPPGCGVCLGGRARCHPACFYLMI